MSSSWLMPRLWPSSWAMVDATPMGLLVWSYEDMFIGTILLPSTHMSLATLGAHRHNTASCYHPNIKPGFKSIPRVGDCFMVS